MQISFIMRWEAAFTCLTLLFFVCASPPLAAQDSAKDQLRESSADQQEICDQTASVRNGIEDLIRELQANKISGPDVQVLQATRAALDHLSGPEMAQVIASLRQASQAPSASAAQKSALDAYGNQKAIMLQFGQILKEYQQRQAIYDLPVRFKELTNRETETMLTTVDVARSTAGKPLSGLTSVQQTTEQIAQTDQDAIVSDANLAREQLDKAVAGSSGDEAKPLRQADNDIKTGQMQQALDKAAQDLKAGMLLQATSEQKMARDELQRITRDLNPPLDAADALTATTADLSKLIDDQKNLLAQTTAAVGVKPRVEGLDSTQGALLDTADTLQRQMQDSSAPESALIKEAMNPMQWSRAELGTRFGSLTKAETDQSDAIAKLEEAQSQAQTQLDQAQKAEEANKDPVAQLQDMQNKLQQIMQQQNELAQQVAQQTPTTPAASGANQPPPANPPQAQSPQTPPNQTAQNPTPANQPPQNQAAQNQAAQNQLAQQTAALQQQAQGLSPAATKALATAANQMNQAQQALANPASTAAAQAAQQAAQAALSTANQQLAQQIAQQIAQTQQPDTSPAALAQAAQALQQAQSSVSSALASSTPATAAQALADASKQTQAAAQTPGLPAAAAQAVQAAQQAIANGQQKASRQNNAAAMAQAATAQQALAQAQAAVAMAQAGMAATADSPTTPQPPNPDSPPGPPSSDAATQASSGPASNEKGTFHQTTGNGKFVALESRDRAAIEQTQEEKRPQEYATQIDQYLKNLADQSSSAQ